MKFLQRKVILILALVLFSPFFTSAQCAMCRAVLQNGKNQSTGAAINDGITYLMIFPYVIAAIIGFVVYRMIKKSHAS